MEGGDVSGGGSIEVRVWEVGFEALSGRSWCGLVGRAPALLSERVEEVLEAGGTALLITGGWGSWECVHDCRDDLGVRGEAVSRGQREGPQGAGVLQGRGIWAVSWLRRQGGTIWLRRWPVVTSRRGRYLIDQVPLLWGGAPCQRFPVCGHGGGGRSQFDPFEVFFGGRMAFEGGDGRLGSILTNIWRLGGGCLGERRGTSPGQ